MTNGAGLFDENGREVAGLNRLLRRNIRKDMSDSDWNVETVAASIMDTVDLTDQWTVFGGLRYDHYDYQTFANFDPDGRGGPLPRTWTEFTNTDGFWNGHAGVTWSFIPAVNVYAAYSTATNINGGESDVGTSCGYGGICVVNENRDLGNPEHTRNLEAGVKWSLLDSKLLATAAVFQSTKMDVMESPSGDSYSVLGTLNTGKNRVQGVELGLSGNLTDKLSVQAGLAVMESEVLESVNLDNVGKPLANFADTSASLHMKYQILPKFSFGGTLTYEGDRHTGQPDTAANEAMTIPAYTVLDLFASLGRNILRSLARNPTFISAALPARIFPPRFNRYRGGETYGPHIDGALMQVPGTDRTLRSDLAATLFLSAPEEYDGGELTVEANAGTQQFKLQAGSLVLYPATSVHFVTPVTRGDRIGSFFWIQSMVRDARQRELLYRLDRTVQALTAELGGGHAEVTNLAGLYHNLIRQWADA